MFIKSFILGFMVISGLMNMLGMVEYKDTTVESKPTVAIEVKEEVKEEVGKVEEIPEVPLGHQMALESAKSYIECSSFSKKGLYQQLTSEYGEGFTDEEAQYAIDNLDVDYKEEALESAKSYIECSSFSKDGLYQQLTSEYGEQFTDEEAQYAIDKLFGK